LSKDTDLSNLLFTIRAIAAYIHAMVGRDKMFYILNAGPDAKIFSGFRNKTN
jgi:hypothetical protein